MGWQPIETAPNLENVLLCKPSMAPAYAIGYRSSIDGEWKVGPFQPLSGFTHWMPLPEPPK
jgi:hypothetical protein